MERVYCNFCGTKIVCNGCLKPSTCPQLEGCISNPHSYGFCKKHNPTNMPYVAIESNKIFCCCFNCSKHHRSRSEMLKIHCWKNLGNQLEIVNPSER